MSVRARFEALLAGGQDNALLRFALGNEYLKSGEAADAVTHLKAAVAHDPAYSAAWKLLGKALLATDQREEAAAAFGAGIDAADRKGDVQAAREMRVFLKRLDKSVNK